MISSSATTLVLPVLAEVIFDRDNDGLDDSIESDADNPDPGVLGPARAEFAEGTGGRANEVSLSLGNLARSLALAECGGVTLTLTLVVDENGSTVTGCGGETRTLDGNADESRDGAIRHWNIPALRSLGHLRQRPGCHRRRFC